MGAGRAQFGLGPMEWSRQHREPLPRHQLTCRREGGPLWGAQGMTASLREASGTKGTGCTPSTEALPHAQE